MNLLQIIKEEIENFWNDEPSIADKYYEKKIGLQPNPQQQEKKITADLIGYVDKQFVEPLNPPVPVYKNPKSLDGFSNDTRGILLANGDLYLALNYNAFHDNILELLAENGLVSYQNKIDYGRRLPKDFIAVVRVGTTKTFNQSSIYDEFPEYYLKLFENSSARLPYNFEEFIYGD